MRPPVFIVGCPRSGTSFLYHLLLSGGGFASFNTQMNVFDVLEPIYADLSIAKNRKAMLQDWLQSKAFKISTLNANEIEAKVMAECSSGSDFIRAVMDEVATKQGVDRWIDSTPTNIPHMLRISRDFPEARFIHIIRDGRDVALSLEKRAWSRPLPWDKPRSLLAAGMYWEWIVRKGRKYGIMLGPKYLEVRYEELVQHPELPLRRIGDFLQHELDYDRIIRGATLGVADGRLTSFEEDLKDGTFSPVGRWKHKFPADQLLPFEKLVGEYMVQLGYPLEHSANRYPQSLGVRQMRWIYINFYDFKQWAKINTPLSRWAVNYSNTLIDK
jgi:Sulfotransferase family